jgi:hypothetical protein
MCMCVRVKLHRGDTRCWYRDMLHIYIVHRYTVPLHQVSMSNLYTLVMTGQALKLPLLILVDFQCRTTFSRDKRQGKGQVLGLGLGLEI